MVWIHGGAFSWGSALNDLYSGHRYAQRGDIVVVALQYRLGALGWLDLRPHGHPSSPNNGLLDQIAASRPYKEEVGGFESLRAHSLWKSQRFPRSEATSGQYRPAMIAVGRGAHRRTLGSAASRALLRISSAGRQQSTLSDHSVTNYLTPKYTVP